MEIPIKAVTKTGRRTSWIVNLKAKQHATSPDEWLAPAAASVAGPPEARDHVAAATWVVHQNWRTSPEAKPWTRNTGLDRARVNTDVRQD